MRWVSVENFCFCCGDVVSGSVAVGIVTIIIHSLGILWAVLEVTVWSNFIWFGLKLPAHLGGVVRSERQIPY